MNLQYISDSNGIPTGVFIPISQWNELKEKYGNLDNVLNDIPLWHKQELDKRMESYTNDPAQILDFDQAMNDIEKDL